MREWVGVRNDISDVGSDALSVAESVSFRVIGEIRRRPGLTKETTEGGLYLTHITSPVAGSSLVTVSSDGTIDAIAI